jgi:hypothetical protein
MPALHPHMLLLACLIVFVKPSIQHCYFYPINGVIHNWQQWTGEHVYHQSDESAEHHPEGPKHHHPADPEPHDSSQPGYVLRSHSCRYSGHYFYHHGRHFIQVYHNVSTCLVRYKIVERTVPKSNWKIVEMKAKSIHLTHAYMTNQSPGLGPRKV